MRVPDEVRKCGVFLGTVVPALPGGVRLSFIVRAEFVCGLNDSIER